MIKIEWNPEKDKLLRLTRGVSFSDVLYHIENDDILDILQHPNQKAYPGQKCFIIEIDQYVYYVPFVETEERIFLKTIIPSRKYTKLYQKGGHHE